MDFTINFLFWNFRNIFLKGGHSLLVSAPIATGKINKGETTWMI